MYSSEDESSELSDLEVDEKIIDKLPWGESGPRLSKDEIKLLNAFTYDKEPVKAWRQNQDYRVLRECNEYRLYEISEFLGKYSGFRDSHLLYANSSKLCNLIEKKLGRKRSFKNAPRSCDIDIIDYKQKILNGVGEKLILPHPRMSERNFVLLPLFELDKSWKHPKTKINIVKLINSLPIKNLTSIKQI